MNRRCFGSEPRARRAAPIARLVVGLLLVLTSGGCLETNQQVFSPEDAVAVPGLEGRYEQSVNGAVTHYTITRVEGGNDYRYTMDEKVEVPGLSDSDPAALPGYSMQVISLGSDLYLEQEPASYVAPPNFFMKPPGQPNYQFNVFRVVRHGDAILRLEALSPGGDFEELAQHDGVAINADMFTERLDGPPDAIARVLRDLPMVSFTVQNTYTRLP